MKRVLGYVLTTLSALALALALSLAGALDRLELIALDARITSGVGRRAPGSDVAVVWVDQESIEYMRRQGVPFPWPRTLYGDVVRYLLDDGARAVALDVLMTEQSAFPADDADFAASLGPDVPVVAAFQFTNARAGTFLEEQRAPFEERALALELPADPRETSGVTLPIPEIERASRGVGFVNVVADSDRVYRHYDFVRRWQGKTYPSLALALRLAGGDAAAPVLEAGRLRVGDHGPAVDERGRALLAFRGPEFTFESSKVVNILESINRRDAGEEPLYAPGRFRDQYVILGINAEGIEDVHPTPWSRLFPGPEIHATALDNLLRADALVEHPAWGWPATGGLAVIATAALLLLPGTLLPLGIVFATAAGFVGVAFLLFARGDVLPMALPLVALALVAGTGFAYRLIVEGKQKRELRRAFTSYMAPAIVEEVVRNPAALKLGGEKRDITVLFSDLAGFTALSESTTPQELVQFLNGYFTRMGNAILDAGGTIDKFIGDAVMALFGAPKAQPDHPDRCLRAVLACQRALDAVNAELDAQGKPRVAMRCGVHSGEAIVGNMGSDRRFDYTAMGDTVNLASRLEGANKYFGTRALVSGASWERLGTPVPGRFVGSLRVVGRREPVAVFEPLGADASIPAGFLEACARGAAALRSGDREAARRGFEEALALRPGDAPCGKLVAALADPGWDFVFALEGK